jgi:mono/diheme cytochrome c family protein
VRRALGPSIALVLLAAGCGEDGGERAAFLWEQRCAPCHSIDPAEPSPALAAPNLGEHPPSAERIRRAVSEGLPGMPAGLVGDDELDELVAYVRERAR